MSINRKQNRLNHDIYHGNRAYSLTICTDNRQKHFLNATTVTTCIDILRQISKPLFEIYAYCFMPDHLHLLIVAMQENVDLIRFIKDFKQQTGFHFKQESGSPLWQKSYYDHVLRKDEDLRTVARYILNNPVRAGLVKDFQEFHFMGSFVYNINDLAV